MVWLITIPVAAAALIWVRRCSRRIRALRAELAESEARRMEIAGFLSRFSSGISGDEGMDGAMHSAARYVCEQTDAEAAAIYEMSGDELVCSGVSGNYLLLRGGGGKQSLRHHRLLEALRRERIPVGRGFLGGMIGTKTAELIPDGAADPRFADYPAADSLGSVMAAPLLRDGVITGVVCALNNRLHPGRSFSEEQFERLRQLVPQVMMVQNLVRVYSEISRRDRIDQELELARHLQLSLLPRSFPRWGAFAIYANTRSAKEVNGDFYDCIRIDDERLLVLIGDACGKGIPACMLTAMTRSFARSIADNFTTLTAFLTELNAKLQRGTEADRFITLGCCLLNRRDSLLEFGRAGHTDLVECVHHHLRIISPDGTALGILPEDLAGFETICIAMEPETTVMMFSDGLTEATDKNRVEFGIERLSQAFLRACESEIPPGEVIGRVMDEVAGFESEQSDDQTIVLIRQDGEAVNAGG